MAQHYPGEGTAFCIGTNRDGSLCTMREIEGLEYCIHHVPDELLDEAEDITGMRRCRSRTRDGMRDCRY